MGKAFLCKSNGGGGGGLAFRVIGGTSAPSNPKPNDIWVNTDEEITSYIFSATEPEAYAEGMVWISVGASSPAAFSATKKDPIMVYPLSAKQYASGTWVDKEAKIYQNGSWVNFWDGELYKAGYEYADITGGWVSTFDVTTFNGVSVADIPATKNAQSISVKTTGNNTASSINTRNMIDMTPYKTLEVDLDVISGNIRVFLTNALAGAFTNNQYGWIVANTGFYEVGKHTATLDVSGINSGVYIAVIAVDGGTRINVDMTKVRVR
jgi:hypothetical protein